MFKHCSRVGSTEEIVAAKDGLDDRDEYGRNDRLRTVIASSATVTADVSGRKYASTFLCCTLQGLQLRSVTHVSVLFQITCVVDDKEWETITGNKILG